MKNVIFHVDLDSFFVASHRKRNPYLKGYPIVVGSDPKGGKGRGVVSTCSYEAREYGIRSGMAISIAYQKCPDAIFICQKRKKGFSIYGEDSDEVMSYLRSASKKFHQGSIDEAYLDVSEDWEHYGKTPVSMAEDIQRYIKENLLLSVSIGIAETRAIAKIASEINKPHGISYVPNEKLKELIWPLPVKSIAGVGKVSASRLYKKGIKTINDIASLTRPQAFHLLGKHGLQLRKIALGKSSASIVNRKVKNKSMSEERTFPEDVKEWQPIIEQTELLVKELCEKAKAKKVGAKTISIKIRFGDYSTFTRARSSSNPIIVSKTVNSIVKGLLIEFRQQAKIKGVRLIGVKMGTLLSYKHQLLLDKFLS